MGESDSASAILVQAELPARKLQDCFARMEDAELSSVRIVLRRPDPGFAHFEQFDLAPQHGVGGDETVNSRGAVGQVGTDDQRASPPHAHAFDPVA